MIPPEGFEGQSTADQIHVELLGRNLYQAATGCNSEDFYLNRYSNRLKPHTDLDFNQPVFGLPGSGQALAELIQACMNPDPGKRPPMDTVIQRLDAIGKHQADPLPVRDTAIAYAAVKACTANPVQLPKGSPPLITDDVHHTDGSDKLVIYSHAVKQLKQIKKSASDDTEKQAIDKMIQSLGSTIGAISRPEGLQIMREGLDTSIDHLRKTGDVSAMTAALQKTVALVAEEEALFKENLKPYLVEYETLIGEIATHRIILGDGEDTLMDDFIEEAKGKMQAVKTLEEAQQVNTELAGTLRTLEQGAKYVQFATDALNEKSQYKYGIGRKKTAVGEAIRAVDIEERGESLQQTLRHALNRNQRLSSTLKRGDETGTARAFQEKVNAYHETVYRRPQANRGAAETTQHFRQAIRLEREQGTATTDKPEDLKHKGGACGSGLMGK